MFISPVEYFRWVVLIILITTMILIRIGIPCSLSIWHRTAIPDATAADTEILKRRNGYLTPRDAAHTCVHSDKQYCLLRKPSLNTMSSFRTEIGPSPGAPAYHNLLWQQHFYTHDNTVYLDCKLLCGRHPLAIAYFLNVQVTSHPQMHDHIHWCLVLTSTHINAYSADPRSSNRELDWRTVTTAYACGHAFSCAVLHLLIFQKLPKVGWFSLTCSNTSWNWHRLGAQQPGRAEINC